MLAGQVEEVAEEEQVLGRDVGADADERPRVGAHLTEANVD